MQLDARMGAIIVRGGLSSRPGAGILVAAALLTVALGCCGFDHDRNMDSVEFCSSLVVTSVTLVLLGRLPLAGWAAPYALAHVPLRALLTPAPPPKSLLS
jgi:hypothetical protein